MFITKNMACGGVERTLLNLLESIDKTQYDVELMLFEKTGEFLSMVPHKVCVSEVIMPENWRKIFANSGKSFKSGFHALWESKQYATAFKYGYVKIVDALSRKLRKKSIINRICSRKLKAPTVHYDIVCDYHGYGDLTTWLAAKCQCEKRFSWIHIEKMDDMFIGARSIYPQFDAFFGVSLQCLDNFKKTFPEIPSERLVLLYNLLLKDQICSLAAQSPSVIYDVKDRFVMTSVGRLSTQKGFDLAIEAAQVLKQHKRRFLWIIIGEGPERSRLEAQIKALGLTDSVVLHGLDNNPYVYMNIADVYVQTSRYEGFATTLSEAIVLNKPIVSTRFSGVDEQVLDGANGLLADFDKYDVAAKLEHMMDDSLFRLSCAEYCTHIKLPMDDTLATLNAWFC